MSHQDLSQLLAKHFDLVIDSPDGIKKLRELILNLAMKGKLVPQDPKDQPASELLKEIEAEKKKLVKTGKIKAPKPLAPIKPEEIPYDLPEGWEWVRLGEIGIINPRNDAPDDFDAGFIPMPLIYSKYNKNHNYETKKWGDIKKGFTHLADGDVGLAKITPCFENAKSCIFYNLPNGIGAGTTELHIFRNSFHAINENYLLSYFKSSSYIKTGKSKMTGSAGQKRVPSSFFIENPFPLPPLSEQKRIVEKIDQLMSLCDQMEEIKQKRDTAKITLHVSALNRLQNSKTDTEFQSAWQFILNNFNEIYSVKENVLALKKEILSLAMKGKLVPHDPKDQPASELLKEIEAEKKKLVKAGKIKAPKPLAPIKPEEIPYDLPEGWEWVRLGEILTFEYGKNLPSEKRSNTGEYHVYGSNGIVGTHNSSNINNKCIVIGRKGSAGALNISLSKGCWVTDVSYSCIPYQKLDLYFLFYLLKNIKLDELGKGIKPGLNREEAYITNVPLPPLSEQKRIVERIEQLMQLCDKLEASLNQTDEKRVSLLDSIMNKG